MPAASCLEIKAGEGDNVVSGNYWLDSVKLGQSVLAPCNMLTGGELSSKYQICSFKNKYNGKTKQILSSRF